LRVDPPGNELPELDLEFSFFADPEEELAEFDLEFNFFADPDEEMAEFDLEPAFSLFAGRSSFLESFGLVLVRCGRPSS